MSGPDIIIRSNDGEDGLKRILVLGSLNIDLVQQVPRMPAPGETLKGQDLQIFAGGKGANQACAAARMGGAVAMAGMVGRDVFAGRLTQELTAAGVDTTRVRAVDGATGSAMILVLASGENVIVISPGANGRVDTAFALEAVASLSAGDILLCQLEIPLETVGAAIEAARGRDAITILDPAPASALPDDLLRAVSILTPNQTEAALLTGEEPPQTDAEAEAIGEALRRRGVERVIVKMGARGCVVAQGEQSFASRGFAVEVFDSTGAGDTFNGALAASLAQGLDLKSAVEIANAAGALSVTKAGAIASIPSAAEVDAFLAQRRK